MKVPTAERQVSKNLGNIPKLPSINTGGPTAYGVGVGQAGEELASTVSSSVQKLAKQREANKKREDAALNARLLNDFKNRNQDQLYSQEEITKNIGGVDYKMLKGAKLREEWQAKGITKDYDDFYVNNQNEFLEKSNDPESLYLQMEAIKQATLPRIGMHEVAQAKADQDNSYKTIIGRAINDAYECGTVKELNVLFDEAEKYQKELDPDGVEDVFSKIADKAVSGAIMRDPSGFEANALLLGMEKKIGKEQRNKLQTSIDKKTSTMRKNLKTQEKKQQYVVGTDLVNKLSNNEIGLSDEESIKDMGVKREISQELTNAVIKTIYNPISEFDDEGKDAAFTDLVKAIISDTDIDRKNKNLVDILNGFTGGDLSQRRMQLLVQTAAEMGIGVEAGDTKKVEYKQNMDAIWEWSEEAGIDKSNMTEDLLESMMQEYDPKTVLEEIKLKEIERQNNSKEKEIKLDKQLSGEILKNFSTGTSLTDVSEKSLYQYLLKSGQEKNEAAATAQEVFNSEDANDIADKMAQAVPEIKYSMPETQQAVKNYNLFTEVVDFLDPKAYAGETEGNDYYNKLLDYEGLETEVYDDSKGIPTIGIGHKIKEGEDFDGYTEDDFKDLFNTKDLPEHLDRTKELINNFDELPLELRKEIVASVYRGGLSGSLETIKLINDGKYKAAAEEFLDNDEYREAKQWEIDNKEPHGVVRRMDNLVNELNNMGEDRLSLLEGLDNLFFTNAQAAETYTEENRYSPERKESIGNTIGNFFEYSFGQPMHSTNAAVQNSFGRMLYPIGEAYDFYLDKLNIGDKTLPRGLQTAAQSYFKIAEEERKKGIVADDAISKITRGLYEGTGALMMKLPVYAAVGAGLGPLASTSMGVVEFTEASPGGTGEAVSAGVKGLAFQQFVKGISLLPRTIQLPTAFTSFAGATALDGGSIEDSVASGVLGVGLSLSGRAPTMSQFRSRYAKNPGMLGEILKHTKSLMKQKSVADYNLWQKDATKTLGKFNSKKAMKSEIETFFKENKIAYNDAKVNSVINDIRNLWSKQVSTANARKTGGLKLLTPRELLGEGIKFERTMKSKIAQEFAKDTPVAESVQNNIKNDVLIDAVQGQTASSKKPITSVKNGEYRVDINPTSSLESGRKGDILIYKEGSAKPVNAGYWMDKSETNDPKYDDLPIEERAQLEAQIQLDKYAEFDFKDRWLEENDFDVHTDIGLNHNWNRDSKGYKAAVIKAFNKSYEDDAQPEQAEVANKVDKVADPLITEAKKYKSAEEVKITKELKNLNAEIVGDKVKLYRGGDVDKTTLKNLRYNDYLSLVKEGKDAQGNSGASEYGKNIIEVEVPIKDIKITNGEIQYIGKSSSLEKGTKYPPEIYKAYNDAYGSNYTAEEIDKQENVRFIASQALEGGRDEFKQLTDIYNKAKVDKVAEPKGPKKVKVTKRKSASDMSTRELVQYIKAKYPGGAQDVYGRFVALRDLKPEINMKEFRDIFNSVGANNFETTTEQTFVPTHVEKGTNRKVQVTFNEGGTKNFLYEDGSTGSNPLDENLPEGYKFKDTYREIGAGDKPKGIDLGEMIKDAGDAFPTALGLSTEDVGSEAYKKRKEAQRRIFEKHLPALKAEAKRLGMELKAYLEHLGRLTKEQIDDILNLAIQQSPPEKQDFVKPTVEEQRKQIKKVDKKVAESFDPEESPLIKKMVKALKSFKRLRGKQEGIYSAERSKRFAIGSDKLNKKGGHKGLIAFKEALSGELTKVEFESIAKEFTQENLEDLYRMITDNRFLLDTEKLTAAKGLSKILGVDFETLKPISGSTLPQAKEILYMSKVFGASFTQAMLENQKKMEKFWRKSKEVLNLPRAVMASGDLSASGRQGIFLGTRHPGIALKAFAKQFGYFNSKEKFNALQDYIVEHPYYEKARRAGLALTDVGAIMSEREEQFRSNLADKWVPLVARSERAYVGTLNYIRFEVFVKMMKQAEAMGMDKAMGDSRYKAESIRENFETDEEYIKAQKTDKLTNAEFVSKAIADFVNAASGRAKLPGDLERASELLNTMFFSPRLWAGRIQMINPLYHIKNPWFYTEVPSFVRKEANKNLATFVAFGSTMMFMLALAGGEAGTDPLSSDFGKIKFGNTRIDLFAGYQQPARLMAQMMMGKTTSSKTGVVTFLNEGYKAKTRADILLQYVSYKESPMLSLLTDYLSKPKYGDYRFNKPNKMFAEMFGIDIPEPLASRFTYMFLQDMFDVIEDDPDKFPVGMLGIFGVGVQAY